MIIAIDHITDLVHSLGTPAASELMERRATAGLELPTAGPACLPDSLRQPGPQTSAGAGHPPFGPNTQARAGTEREVQSCQ